MAAVNRVYEVTSASGFVTRMADIQIDAEPPGVENYRDRARHLPQPATVPRPVAVDRLCRRHTPLLAASDHF